MKIEFPTTFSMGILTGLIFMWLMALHRDIFMGLLVSIIFTMCVIVGLILDNRKLLIKKIT